MCPVTERLVLAGPTATQSDVLSRGQVKPRVLMINDCHRASNDQRAIFASAYDHFVHRGLYLEGINLRIHIRSSDHFDGATGLESIWEIDTRSL